MVFKEEVPWMILNRDTCVYDKASKQQIVQAIGLLGCCDRIVAVAL